MSDRVTHKLDHLCDHDHDERDNKHFVGENQFNHMSLVYHKVSLSWNLNTCTYS